MFGCLYNQLSARVLIWDSQQTATNQFFPCMVNSNLPGTSIVEHTQITPTNSWLSLAATTGNICTWTQETITSLKGKSVLSSGEMRYHGLDLNDLHSWAQLEKKVNSYLSLQTLQLESNYCCGTWVECTDNVVYFV